MDGRLRTMRHGTLIIIGGLLLAGMAWRHAPLDHEPQNPPPSPPPTQSDGHPSSKPRPALNSTRDRLAPPAQDEPRHLKRTAKPGKRFDVKPADDKAPGPPEAPRAADDDRAPGREFTPEQIDRLMQVVRDLDPDRAAKLETLRDHDPDRFAFVLSRTGRHLLGLSLLKDRDPELYGLKLAELRMGQQVNRIAQEIHAARETCSEEELGRLQTMLRERIREQSDLNFKARAREIILLDDHLKNMRERLVSDITNRDALVEERLQELLRTGGEEDVVDAETSFAAEHAAQP